jgi:hypothetical protein
VGQVEIQRLKPKKGSEKDEKPKKSKYWGVCPSEKKK